MYHVTITMKDRIEVDKGIGQRAFRTIVPYERARLEHRNAHQNK